MVGAKTERKEDTEDHSIPAEAIDEVAQVNIRPTHPLFKKDFLIKHQSSKINVESISQDVFGEPKLKVMPTLPPFFKSLAGRSIDIADGNQNPQDLIAYGRI